MTPPPFLINLPEAARCWGTPAFGESLKAEIETLDAAQLPLQDGLSHSSHVSDEPFRAMIIKTRETGSAVEIHLGIFYTGIIAGCNCADDPTPPDPQTEYCELLVTLDTTRGDATVTLLPD